MYTYFSPEKWENSFSRCQSIGIMLSVYEVQVLLTVMNDSGFAHLRYHPSLHCLEKILPVLPEEVPQGILVFQRFVIQFIVRSCVSKEIG